MLLAREHWVCRKLNAIMILSTCTLFRSSQVKFCSFLKCPCHLKKSRQLNSLKWLFQAIGKRNLFNMKDRIFTNTGNHGDKDPRPIWLGGILLEYLNFTLLIFEPNISKRYSKSFVQTLTFLSHMNLWNVHTEKLILF